MGSSLGSTSLSSTVFLYALLSMAKFVLIRPLIIQCHIREFVRINCVPFFSAIFLSCDACLIFYWVVLFAFGLSLCYFDILLIFDFLLLVPVFIWLLQLLRYFLILVLLVYLIDLSLVESSIELSDLYYTIKKKWCILIYSL